VRSVGVDPSGGVELGLDVNARAVLGDTSDLSAKFVAGATLLARTPVAGRVIDLRVSSAPVLTGPENLS